MARKRRTPTARQVINVLLMQGAVIPCYRCGVKFSEASRIEREHVTPLALGGEDTPANWRFSHKKCHALQTNGTKATSYGSDKHAIAKVRRIKKKAAAPKDGGSRWGKGRKLQSRSFSKRQGSLT